MCFGLLLHGRFIKLPNRFYIQIVHRPLHIAFIFVHYMFIYIYIYQYVYVCMLEYDVRLWLSLSKPFIVFYMFNVRFASPVGIFLFNNIPYYKSDINIFIFVYIVYTSSIHRTCDAGISWIGWMCHRCISITTDS